MKFSIKDFFTKSNQIYSFLWFWSHLKNPLLFHDGGPFHIETSPLIFSPNEWTGFYMIGTDIMKELMENFIFCVVLLASYRVIQFLKFKI